MTNTTLVLLSLLVANVQETARSSPAVQRALRLFDAQRRSESTAPLDGQQLCELLPRAVGSWKAPQLFDRAGRTVPSCNDAKSGGWFQGTNTAAMAVYSDGNLSKIEVLISDHAAYPDAVSRTRVEKDLVDAALRDLAPAGQTRDRPIPLKILDCGQDVFGFARGRRAGDPQAMTATDHAEAQLYARHRFRVKISVTYLSSSTPKGLSEVEAYARALAAALAKHEQTASRSSR